MNIILSLIFLLVVVFYVLSWRKPPIWVRLENQSVTAKRFELISFLILLWIFSAFGIHYGLSQLNIPFWTELAEHGISTKGMVTIKEPTNHATIHYTFEVAGNTYSGKGQASSGNPEFDQLHWGDSILIVYLPSNPEFSYPGNPNLLLKNEWGAINLATLVVPILAVGALLWKTNKIWNPRIG